MSSQKIGPYSLASRVRCCTGAFVSSESMLPTTGLAGGCGIGLSLLLDGIVAFGPSPLSFRSAQREPVHNRRPLLLLRAIHDLSPVRAEGHGFWAGALGLRV